MPSLLGTQPPGLIEAVLDDVGVALVIIDKAGKVVLANRAVRRILGDETELNGMAFADIRRNFRIQDSQGRDIPIAEGSLTRALAGEPIEPQDLRLILPDGQRKWLHAAGHKFSVFGLSGVLVVILEETEQVELRHANEQLRRLEAAGVLAGGLAHDFNNMLSVVGENAALALADPGVPEETRERLRQMSLALKRTADLVSRLVQFSRTQELTPRWVDVNQVVDTALALMRPMVGSKIRLEAKLKPGLPSIEASPAELEQVLINLVLNALDAMPQGGELTVETDVAGRDAVGCHEGERPDGFVCIGVSDTGVGIPESLQTMIFEPFFTTKPPGKGAGLGLASAYGIVRHHHGSIKVQSRPGNGTKFTIYLPVKTTSRTQKEVA